ncbi:hypothetical protein H6F89_30495 [Cyanobacteria bacterium FACHB-63]|nr:hypothetical protein [Cyanobacteria bacterium FACHB-63]
MEDTVEFSGGAAWDSARALGFKVTEVTRSTHRHENGFAEKDGVLYKYWEEHIDDDWTPGFTESLVFRRVQESSLTRFAA